MEQFDKGLVLLKLLFVEYVTWRVGIQAPAMEMSSDNIRGFALALSSSFFIGSSFIVKKIGLKKAGMYGVRAGSASFSIFHH